MTPAAEKPDTPTAGDLEHNLIDAHVHVWTPDLARYPLAAGFTRAEMNPPSFTPEQLFEHCRPAGVSRVMLIQMSYYGTDNAYMLDSIRRFPDTFRGTAVVNHQAANLAETVAGLSKQGVRGFRIYPGEQKIDVEKWLFDPGMQRLWKVATEQRMVIGALINSDSLPLVDRMCQQMPETQVVIDHFGRIGMHGTIAAADLDNLCRLARHKHTYVKVSAFYALGKKQAPYLDLAPMIKRLLATFGPQRLMWASDCPFQVQNSHTYRDSIDLVRRRLDFLTPADRLSLLRTTAERLYFS